MTEERMVDWLNIKGIIHVVVLWFKPCSISHVGRRRSVFSQIILTSAAPSSWNSKPNVSNTSTSCLWVCCCLGNNAWCPASPNTSSYTTDCRLTPDSSERKKEGCCSPQTCGPEGGATGNCTHTEFILWGAGRADVSISCPKEKLPDLFVEIGIIRIKDDNRNQTWKFADTHKTQHWGGNRGGNMFIITFFCRAQLF